MVKKIIYCFVIFFLGCAVSSCGGDGKSIPLTTLSTNESVSLVADKTHAIANGTDIVVVSATIMAYLSHSRVLYLM